MTQSIQVGPVSVPLGMLVIIAAVALGVYAGKRAGCRLGIDVESQIFQVLIVALACARLAFVWQYRTAYTSAPLDILDIRDAGGLPQVGIIAAWVYVSILVWLRPMLRKPLLIAVSTASVIWIAGLSALAMMPQNESGLPDMAFSTLEGGTTSLRTFKGKPTIVNLWATWCPPCQREMPLLRRAQAEHPELNFVFLNQGEAADKVRSFLMTHNLSLNHVLFDPEGLAGLQFHAQAFPTTFFFDAQGKFIDKRIGLLSQATLMQHVDFMVSKSTSYK